MNMKDILEIINFIYLFLVVSFLITLYFANEKY